MRSLNLDSWNNVLLGFGLEFLQFVVIVSVLNCKVVESSIMNIKKEAPILFLNDKTIEAHQDELDMMNPLKMFSQSNFSLLVTQRQAFSTYVPSVICCSVLIG